MPSVLPFTRQSFAIFKFLLPRRMSIIKSIINNLGTQKIPRLKIGIAHDRSIDTKDYVLGHFNKDDLKLFENKTQIFNNIIKTSYTTIFYPMLPFIFVAHFYPSTYYINRLRIKFP